MMNNCFNFTINKLKKLGIKNRYIKENSFIIYNLELFYKNVSKLRRWHLSLNHQELFVSQFCKKTNDPKENNIITHSKGIGIVVDNKHYQTTNHYGDTRIYPIEGIYKLWEVVDGW